LSLLVSDVVEKTSTQTRRRSRIPCVVVEKNYDASTWKRRRRRGKKWRKSTNFQQKFVWFIYSNNADRNSVCVIQHK